MRRDGERELILAQERALRDLADAEARVVEVTTRAEVAKSTQPTAALKAEYDRLRIDL